MVTRSLYSADCDTDHSLVCCRIRLTPKKIHHTKQSSKPRINTTQTSDPKIQEAFNTKLSRALEANIPDALEDKWHHIRDAIYNSAVDTLGKKERRHQDWFEANIHQMEPLIKEK